MRFIRFLIFALLLWPCLAFAQTAPTFVAASAIAADAAPHVDLTITVPAHNTDDIIACAAFNRDVDETATMSGYTAFTGSPVDRGTSSRYWFWWRRATGSDAAVVDFNGTTGDAYGVCTVYRGAETSGDPWETAGTPTTGTADPAALTTISSLTNNALIVVLLMGEDNNNAACTTTGTDPASYTTHYDETGTGADAMVCPSEAARSTFGATGTVNTDFDTAVPVGWGALLLALKPVIVTCAQDIRLLGVGCR